MPQRASEVTVEAGESPQGGESRPLQSEDNRLLSQSRAMAEERLPDTPLTPAQSQTSTSRPPRQVVLSTAPPLVSSPQTRRAQQLSFDVDGSPCESVASPPFHPTSRHHSFFMDDLDSHAGDGEKSPVKSGQSSWPGAASPTAAFDGVMARSRSQRLAAAVAANTGATPATAAAGATDEAEMSAAAVLTTSHAEGATDTVDGVPQPQQAEVDVEVKPVVRRKHRHRLVAKAPPFDPSRPQQLNLLTFGPDPDLPLYTFAEIPHWQKYNPYIRSGYRAFYTAGMCLKSMLGWHNETINVYSHFITFIIFVVFTVLLYTTVLSKAISAPSMASAKLMYGIFCFGSMLCTLNSSIYHLCNCHSHQRVMTAMGRLDFVGITVLIVASFLPPLYVMFHCYTTLRIVYIATILVLGSVAIIGPWTNVFHEHVGLRVATFLGLAFSGIVPAVHSAFLMPLTTATFSVIKGVVLMVLLYCGGVVFYVTQFPENKFPGHFDFWLSSHQIWHFFVSMAALVHYFNCVSMYQMWQISDGFCT